MRKKTIKPGQIDIKRMQDALAEESVLIPPGLNREEMRKFILDHKSGVSKCGSKTK